jgi:hypothetical protein
MRSLQSYGFAWVVSSCTASLTEARLRPTSAAAVPVVLQALTSSLSEVFDTSGAAGGVITITCSLPSGGEVGELWAAMDVAGLAEQQLQKVAGLCRARQRLAASRMQAPGAYDGVLLWQVMHPFNRLTKGVSFMRQSCHVRVVCTVWLGVC